MIVARFIDRTWDGKVKRVEGARTYCVPVLQEPIGHADDFKWINLDEVWNGRHLTFETQTYYRRTICNEDGSVNEYVYEQSP